MSEELCNGVPREVQGRAGDAAANMTREGPIVRSALGSSAFHGVLLVAAFSVYDPVELETRD